MIIGISGKRNLIFDKYVWAGIDSGSKAGYLIGAVDCWRDGENSERSECSTVWRSDLPGAKPPALQPNMLVFQGSRVLGVLERGDRSPISKTEFKKKLYYPLDSLVIQNVV
ncbi:hypothetical protein QT971_13110 [Microcoleus sp. herbarium19]|uniref:hypothetical protein n=1 Tax=unclassified Microcoleus TaxID=2642155 RepID=UPI002FD2F35C